MDKKIIIGIAVGLAAYVLSKKEGVVQQVSNVPVIIPTIMPVVQLPVSVIPTTVIPITTVLPVTTPNVPYVPVVQNQVVVVDAGISRGLVTGIGSGFLHGMTEGTPPSSIVEPLKVKHFRAAKWSHVSQIYNRAVAMGATVEYVISDGYNNYSTPWPGDNGDYSGWVNFVASIVNEERVNGRVFQWDIWNEPDISYFWARSVDQYYETWRQGFVTIKSIDPNAVIVGPSMSSYGSGGNIKNFLLYAKAHNVLPTIVSWHEFEEAELLEYHVAEMRQWMAANGINIQRIIINEFLGSNYQYSPGSLVNYLAAIGRSGIENACNSCWGEFDGSSSCANYDLDGAVTKDASKQPLARWWVYRKFADLVGNLIDVQPTNESDAVASLGNASLQILFGRKGSNDATVDVLVKNIPLYLISGGSVNVKLERIENTWDRPMTPDIVGNSRYSVSNGQVSISLGTSGSTAYMVTVTA